MVNVRLVLETKKYILSKNILLPIIPRIGECIDENDLDTQYEIINVVYTEDGCVNIWIVDGMLPKGTFLNTEDIVTFTTMIGNGWAIDIETPNKNIKGENV